MIPTTGKIFDLEERTFRFAERVRDLLRCAFRTLTNVEYIKQLARSSGSVGANYTEANDALGENDFMAKIKTSRREAKESLFWLRLLELEQIQEADRAILTKEAKELIKILSAILQSRERKTSSIH